MTIIIYEVYSNQRSLTLELSIDKSVIELLV